MTKNEDLWFLKMWFDLWVSSELKQVALVPAGSNVNHVQICRVLKQVW